jgi:hypothetical protein
VLGADDIVYQQLTARPPEHAGHSMNSEQQTSLPNLDGVGPEQQRPGRGDAHIHELRQLNDFTAIIAIRHGAEINREQKKRGPVNQHGKAGQGWRSKFLVQQPIADDMLDIIGHHRQHGANEVNPEVLVMQRGKGNFLGRRQILSLRGFLYQTQLRAGITQQRVDNGMTGRSKGSEMERKLKVGVR